jgi:hypothetical protein
MGSAITRPVDISPEDRSKLTEQLISKCQEVLKQNPNNRCCKFSVQYLGSDHARSLSNAGENHMKRLGFENFIGFVVQI